MALALTIGVVPVVVFLLVLVLLDSYKLVKLWWVLATIAAGCLVAGASFTVNQSILVWLSLDERMLIRYVAPVVEEAGKALLIVFLLRGNRIGFLVDAAIYGFAAGTGFALGENTYYAMHLSDAHPGVWLVRGFGTAIMHGGTTAIFAILGRSLSDKERLPMLLAFSPGFIIAIIVHSVFNHFILNPFLSTLGILLVLPPLVFLVFNRSENALREWLDVGFDADTELLELINSGELSRSRVGLYLQSLKEKFKGEVVADMLCYLKLHTELSLRAKGLLMMRESGFTVEIDPEIRGRFEELSYLDGSIGRTGKLAMAPFLRQENRDLWQLYMIKS